MIGWGGAGLAVAGGSGRGFGASGRAEGAEVEAADAGADGGFSGGAEALLVVEEGAGLFVAVLDLAEVATIGVRGRFDLTGAGFTQVAELETLMAPGNLVLTVRALELAELFLVDRLLGGGGVDGVLLVGWETCNVEGLLAGA